MVSLIDGILKKSNLQKQQKGGCQELSQWNSPEQQIYPDKNWEKELI
jgi:hypothetical protein